MSNTADGSESWRYWTQWVAAIAAAASALFAYFTFEEAKRSTRPYLMTQASDTSIELINIGRDPARNITALVMLIDSVGAVTDSASFEYGNELSSGGSAKIKLHYGEESKKYADSAIIILRYEDPVLAKVYHQDPLVLQKKKDSDVQNLDDFTPWIMKIDRERIMSHSIVRRALEFVEGKWTI